MIMTSGQETDQVNSFNLGNPQGAESLEPAGVVLTYKCSSNTETLQLLLPDWLRLSASFSPVQKSPRPRASG